MNKEIECWGQRQRLDGSRAATGQRCESYGRAEGSRRTALNTGLEGHPVAGDQHMTI